MKNPEVIQLLQSHSSVRKYKNTPIPDDTLEKMIHAAQHAASSHFVQAYSVIRITNKEKIDAIARFSSNEHQIKSAPIVLLFCADLKRLEHACKKQNISLTHDTVENFIVTVVDTSLFAQSFVIAAESQGYGICYIGGVRNNPAEISDIVELPDKVFPLFGMTIGVPVKEQWVKPRLPVQAILHENEYDEEKYEDIINAYDETLANYYKERLSNNRDTNWSETMSNYLKGPNRQHMKEFIKSKGFHLD